MILDVETDVQFMFLIISRIIAVFRVRLFIHFITAITISSSFDTVNSGFFKIIFKTVFEIKEIEFSE